MLTINFKPIRRDDDKLSIFWSSPIITINNNEYDLSELPDGATATHPVLNEVSREGDDYMISLLLSHGGNAPYSTRFPSPVSITNNGPVEVPIYNTRQEVVV